MKVQVVTDDGRVVFDSRDSSALFSVDLKGDIANALHDAQAALSQDEHVIASVVEDVRAAAFRIESELGAHPAFTWAQTKLGNAIAHLEAYVKGEWAEPKQGLVPPGTGYDQRGVLVVTGPEAYVHGTKS
jgi:hypothetical protein